MKSPCFLGQCDIDLESADVQERHTRADRTPTCITITEYTKKLKPRARDYYLNHETIAF